MERVNHKYGALLDPSQSRADSRPTTPGMSIARMLTPCFYTVEIELGIGCTGKWFVYSNRLPQLHTFHNSSTLQVGNTRCSTNCTKREKILMVA